MCLLIFILYFNLYQLFRIRWIIFILPYWILPVGLKLIIISLRISSWSGPSLSNFQAFYQRNELLGRSCVGCNAIISIVYLKYEYNKYQNIKHSLSPPLTFPSVLFFTFYFYFALFFLLLLLFSFTGVASSYPSLSEPLSIYISRVPLDKLSIN